jgi:hypothetical protein
MTNIELIEFYNSVNKCTDVYSLNNFYDKVKYLNHPRVFHVIGVKYFNFGDKTKAKELLIKGAKFGIKYPSEYFNKPDIDSIGQCLALLSTQFYLSDQDIFYKANCLAYIYLSRAIQLNENLAYDSLRTRATLLKDNKNPNSIFLMIYDNLQQSTLKEPFIISDFYLASLIERNPNRNNDLKSAIGLHKYLEDISIAGKDADEYTLNDLSEIGKYRHEKLYKSMSAKFLNGEFYMNDIEA